MFFAPRLKTASFLDESDREFRCRGYFLRLVAGCAYHLLETRHGLQFDMVKQRNSEIFRRTADHVRPLSRQLQISVNRQHQICSSGVDTNRTELPLASLLAAS